MSRVPSIGLILIFKSTTCVLMPKDRFPIWTLAIVSGGVKAVLNPLVLVVFSWDFWQAFRHTCARADAPLAVGVYYESLCPDCKNFVVDQLNVTVSRVPDLVNVTLVPWGKANVSSDDGSVHCQHGPEECWANRLHGCVAAAIDDASVRTRAVACLMAAQKTLRADGPACLQEPPLTFAPTMTLDGSQGTAEQQKQLLDDLLGVVCSTWQQRTGQTPAGCQQ
ncbi:gamma-interferon-inducible lysosomal thiol reductase-like [Pollicipes pollicipes]|uniref:gamma-interferon-inducible lysosomal thiol reductase-like n=1 Tax=Pollicipes pollicipes TaxID=41117 RepID=UPI001884C9BB|nr:gamma-interferon-inducible lysosomal thiol reductase-like [Pollicipes pollicipes]